MLLLNKDTKFESNSQLILSTPSAGMGCFYWTKIQNLKAILNLIEATGRPNNGAFTEQRYKIWKQFSTTTNWRCTMTMVLLLNKDTKFESNSQPASVTLVASMWCFYWTKIQNLKAILNYLVTEVSRLIGAFTEQRYKIWKQFSTQRPTESAKRPVLLLNKDTKFESNSQQILEKNILGALGWFCRIK